jgi:hypothetical protein
VAREAGISRARRKPRNHKSALALAARQEDLASPMRVPVVFDTRGLLIIVDAAIARHERA